MIEAAKRGERDVEKLIEYGLGRNDGVAQRAMKFVLVSRSIWVLMLSTSMMTRT
jgi:hypothetical protein